MVLNHVAQRARFLIVAGSRSHAFRLTDGNLDVIDILMVPDRFENTVGKPDHHKILNRLFPEIVIDPENLRFIEHLAGHFIDLLGRGQVAPHRFFDDDSRVGRGGGRGGRQTCLGQSLADRREGAGGNAQIKDAIAGQLHRLLHFLRLGAEGGIGLRILVLSLNVKEMRFKRVPRVFRQSLSRMFDDSFLHQIAELIIGHGFAAQPDHRILGR